MAMKEAIAEQIDGRVLDPLVECIGEGARRYGLPFARDLLAQLPRNAEGLLPYHQAPAALDLAANYARDAGRVIAAILQPLEALDQPVGDGFFSDDADNAAHGP